jgi:hypothetical protein
MNGGAAGGMTAAAAIANAIKASGAIIRVESSDFLTILQRSEQPLVVMVKPGFLSPNYRYLTGYKGLTFYTKSKAALKLPGNAELINCRSIYIPS